VHHSKWWSDAYEEDPQATPHTEQRYSNHAAAVVDDSGVTRRALLRKPEVGRSELTLSNPVLKAPTASALETII